MIVGQPVIYHDGRIFSTCHELERLVKVAIDDGIQVDRHLAFGQGDVTIEVQLRGDK